jgi:hypothetical protein
VLEEDRAILRSRPGGVPATLFSFVISYLIAHGASVLMLSCRIVRSVYSPHAEAEAPFRELGLDSKGFLPKFLSW